jgi:hypothetical protein
MLTSVIPGPIKVSQNATSAVAAQNQMRCCLDLGSFRPGVAGDGGSRSDGVPRADDVLGVISKEHIADPFVESIKLYSAGDAIF